MLYTLSLIFYLLFCFPLFSQGISTPETFSTDSDSGDLNIGGDIFSDFNEELESGQVMEDERFYRYGRFYSLNISIGKTTFSGNRGRIYRDQDPSIGLSISSFLNFQNVFGLGIAYSKHNFVISSPTITFNQKGGPGLIEANYFRSLFYYRYYIDTSDLGTAITYSNPYLTGQFQYWYQTNKFIYHPNVASESGSSIGFALGGGLEFPIIIKESYLGVEALIHFVNLPDTYSPNYRTVTQAQDGTQTVTGQGVNDLRGVPFTFFISYVINW